MHERHYGRQARQVRPRSIHALAPLATANWRIANGKSR
jgi:hypothetical protein